MASRSSSNNGPLNVLVLKHVKGRMNEKSQDVTTLDWNVSSPMAPLFECCVGEGLGLRVHAYCDSFL